MPDLSWKFHEKPFTRLSVKQTRKQSNTDDNITFAVRRSSLILYKAGLVSNCAALHWINNFGNIIVQV